MAGQLWAVGGLVLIGAGAVAVGGGALREGRGAGRIEFLRDELRLSEEQVDQLRRLQADERKAQIRRRAELEVARLELRELLTAPALDEAAVAAKVGQLNGLQAALLQARVDARVAFRKTLSAEQVERLKGLRDRHPGRFGRGGGHPHDGLAPAEEMPERP